MPLSLVVDIGSLLYALVNVFHPDWLIRSNFRLCRSDNLHKDSHQNSWIYPRVKRELGKPQRRRQRKRHLKRHLKIISRLLKNVRAKCVLIMLESVAKCRGLWVVGRGRGSWVWVKIKL